MLKLAVVGKDVSASASPRMHTFILEKLGETCSYEKISIPPEEFSAYAESLFRDYDAFNVTIPFKGEIIPYLKELRGDARTFGAVNTVVCRERTGYNTDGYGFMLMLEDAGVAVSGKKVLVLGVGGAGRSCIKKLTEAGAEVYAYGRRMETVQSAHQDLGGFTPLERVPIKPFDMIINCTGVGMHDTVGMTPPVRLEDGSVIPVGEELLSLCGAAVDLIYEPKESEFLRIARACKKPAVSGGAMLFYQAYYADCIFIGRTPDAEEAKKLWESYSEENE